MHSAARHWSMLFVPRHVVLDQARITGKRIINRRIWVGRLEKRGMSFGIPSPGPDSADESGEGKRVFSMLVRVPIEEQSMQEMLDPAE